MWSGEDVKIILRRVVDEIDTSRGLVRAVAVPAAMGLAVGLGGCLGDGVEDLAAALEGKGDGFAEQRAFDSCLTPPELCDDRIDNDGDGFVDCIDFDCMGRGACEGVLLYAAPMEQDCEDGADNDGDGFADCQDEDCARHCACEPEEPEEQQQGI